MRWLHTLGMVWEGQRTAGGCPLVVGGARQDLLSLTRTRPSHQRRGSNGFLKKVS